MISTREEVDCSTAASELAAAGAEFHRHGWVPASTGNFSARLSTEPFRAVITRKVVDKSSLSDGDFVVVDQTGALIRGSACPSAETAIHLAIMRTTGAGAVLHTHSLHDVVLSERHARAGGVSISGFEMLKALAGVQSHLHREWLPVLENSQDYRVLVREVEASLARHAESHGFFLKAHGLYTWGRDIAEARRHVEALEFLAEVLTRLS